MAKFELYSYYRSSASYRVRIAMSLKNLDFDLHPINLIKDGGEQKSESYRKLNPSAQVPTFLHDGKVIGQSIAIIDYLDAIVPTPKLFSAEPYQRALQLQACEIINSGIQPLHNAGTLAELGTQGKFDDELKKNWTIYWITTGMRAFEKFISSHCKEFCFGSRVSAVDAFMVPSFYNVQRYQIDESKFPNCMRIAKTCLELEAFQRAHPNAQPDFPPPG